MSLSQPKPRDRHPVQHPLRHGLSFVLVGHLLSGLVPLVPLPARAQPSINSVTPAEPEPGEEKPLNNQCQSSPVEANGLANLVSNIMQTATLVEEPATGVSTLLANWMPPVAAYLAPSPFPTIHERAKLARVPVIMYHDILPQKEVFFDVTPEEFEHHLELIKANGLTPISMDQLVAHLHTGLPLPEKPILLTFDDGYLGHYKYVYPLLKKYGYPGTFAIYTKKVGKKLGRSSLNWEQLQEMAADPLVTISSHSVTHPHDMTKMTDAQIQTEAVESKRLLEDKLGIPIHYFTYPEGKYDGRVISAVESAGYTAALTMNDDVDLFAGQSNSLLEIARIGQSRLETVIPKAWGGAPLPTVSVGFDFNAPIQVTRTTIDNTPFILISGGKPMTVHAKTRGQLPEIIAGTEAVAAVDGGFFSLEFLDSNVMIGPVMSRVNSKFIPNKVGERSKITGRPLVLISPQAVKFVPYNPDQHNTLEGVQAEMPNLTDVFLAAAWLVRDGQPQPAEAFGKLFDFNAARHRAFWGINQAGQPMIGVSTEPIGSVDLGAALAKAGFRDAVMLDSGASTSLAYKGESLVGYTPRPVPHAVALVPATAEVATSCTLASR